MTESEPPEQASSLKRNRPDESSDEVSDADLRRQWEEADRRRANGRAFYWSRAKTVIDWNRRRVMYQCPCGAMLSTRNPADSLGKHMIQIKGGGVSCKGDTEYHSDLTDAEKHLSGVSTLCLICPTV